MKILNIGATGGIGQELSKELSRRDHEVYGVGRKKDVLERLKGEKSLTDFLVADINTQEGRIAIVSYLSQTNMDCLIYSHGLLDANPLHISSEEEVERIIKTNLTSVMLTDQLVLQKGRFPKKVIYLASVSSFFSWEAGTAYQASKTGLLGHIQAMRLQDKKYSRDIERVVLYPDTIDTEAGMSSNLGEFPKIPGKVFVEEFANIIEEKYPGRDFLFEITEDDDIVLKELPLDKNTQRPTYQTQKELKQLGKAVK